MSKLSIITNKNYKYLLFDLDDTILSFTKSEDYSITKTFEYFGIEPTKENKKIFVDINDAYWKRYEKREVTNTYLFFHRFLDTFEIIKPTKNLDKINEVNDIYFSYLMSVVYFIDGSMEVLRKLKTKYRIFVVTNGDKKVQRARLDLAPELYDLVEKFYVSDEIGYTKPQIEFMNYVLNDLNAKKEECLVIGDSLTSDMKLGQNSNVDTIWFNNKNKNSVDTVTYEIKDIHELLDLLM